jgi:hypothetical protein
MEDALGYLQPSPGHESAQQGLTRSLRHLRAFQIRSEANGVVRTDGVSRIRFDDPLNLVVTS